MTSPTPRTIVIRPDNITIQGSFADYESESLLSTAYQLQSQQAKQRQAEADELRRRNFWLRYGPIVPAVALGVLILLLAALGGCSRGPISESRRESVSNTSNLGIPCDMRRPGQECSEREQRREANG